MYYKGWDILEGILSLLINSLPRVLSLVLIIA